MFHGKHQLHTSETEEVQERSSEWIQDSFENSLLSSSVSLSKKSQFVVATCKNTLGSNILLLKNEYEPN